MRVLIDNGHGCDTKGKRSPNGLLQEWECTRQIAKMIFDKLTNDGIECYLLVTEDIDISLNERVERANKHYKDDNETILISLHLNASGNNDEWRKANGWQCIVTDRASKQSKQLADCIATEVEKYDIKLRKQYKDRKYWVDSKLTILKNTDCPAVLTENLFMDNYEDYLTLIHQSGKQLITDIHVAAIKNYIKNLNENEQQLQ